MTNIEVRAAERRIPGALLAGIRFLGQFEEFHHVHARLAPTLAEGI